MGGKRPRACGGGGRWAGVEVQQGDARTAQERALEILQFKLDVLWQMNDAMALRYGTST